MRKTILIICVIPLLFISANVCAQNVYEIRIKLSEFKLMLSREEAILAEFIIATPKVAPKKLPIEAIVLNVQLNPYWRPTPATREAYKNQRKIILPELLAPGDPRNAMGKGIIRLKYLIPGSMDPNVVIHGTNDDKSIGENITRGCIRMHNEDVIKLINIIRNKNTRVIFEK